MTPPARFWVVLCGLSVGCSKTGDAARPPDHEGAPQIAATGGSVRSGAAAAETTGGAGTAKPPPTTALAPEPFPSCRGDAFGYSLNLGGLTQDQVTTRFGPPDVRKSYRADDVGGEFYLAIEHAYPSKDPKNREVPIEEWTWKAADCFLTVWFHRPTGYWEALDDVFWHKDTAF